MEQRFFEISKKMSKGGRRKVKLALLEVYQDSTTTNKNGIHWTEENVLNNIGSAIDIPICCEFIDEIKRVPFGHGMTSIDVTENEPLFEDSEGVGHINKAYLEDILIDEQPHRVLMGEGYLYAQRYPQFIEWLDENLSKGRVWSSIEIVGKPENDKVIVYEESEPSKEFRTPKIFDFSATAILSIEAADDSALIIEMNNKIKEDKTMGEETISIIKQTVKDAVSEMNTAKETVDAQINELNQTIASKDSEIAELNTKISELSQQLENSETKVTEANAKIEELNNKCLEHEKEIKKVELNSALEGFSDEEKDYAKAEIESFNADPMSVEINSIVDKIYVEIGKASKQPATRTVSETSSKAEEVDDIFGEVCEINSDVSQSEDINIFE